MKNYLGKIFYLIGDDVKKLPWMLVLFLTLSLLEVIGLSFDYPLHIANHQSRRAIK